MSATRAESAGDARREPFRWGFLSGATMILLLVVVGQAVGVMLADYPPLVALRRLCMGEPALGRSMLGELPALMTLRDWLFTAFGVSTLVFLWLQREALKRFFRSMQVGVSLVILSTVAVLLGVLVPQIDGFEDPEQRVTAENYEEQYSAFRWAEGYFLYHLMHPYGQGLPDAEFTPGMVDGLTRYGERYGEEERKNREKQMRAAFSGPLKSQEIGEFIDRNDATLRSAFDVCTALHLNRTYKSHWFASLLFLLAAGVAFNTFKGSRSRWLSIHKIGYFVTHMGILVMLAGGFVSKLGTDRGVLHLDLTEPPRDTYYRHFRPDKLARMPFHVRLDRFARQDWKQVQVIFEEEEFTSRPPSYTLWKDREILLDYRGGGAEARPALRLRVLDIFERARVEVPFIREGFDPENPSELFPVAELEVPARGFGDPLEAAAASQRVHMTPQGRNQLYVDPDMRFRMKVVYGRDDELPFPPSEGQLGVLELSVASSPRLEPERVPFGLGDELELEDGWRVRVERATANFVLDPNTNAELRDPRPLAEQPPLRPAVWLQVLPPDGGEPEQRFLLDRIDWVEQGFQERFEHPELVARLFWDGWAAPGPPRYVLHWGPEQGPRLLDQDGASRPVEPGRPLPLVETEEVVARQFVHLAEFERNLTFLEPREEGTGFDEDFYATDPVGVELEITRDPGAPGERSEVVRLATVDLHDFWRSDDGSVVVWFFENVDMLPYEWRSVLSILEEDNAGDLYAVPLGHEAQREIRVNDYFQYGGYRFFQTNADARFPTYSGIGVVYDPGIPVVLAGMYTIIAGTFLAFVVRPIVLARRQGRAA